MFEYLLIIITMFSIFGIYTLSLNLQWGYAGIPNLGPVAFMAIGAYTMILLSNHGIPLLICIIAGVVSSGVSGAVVAFLGIGLKDEYFALLTLGLAHTLNLVIRRESWITGGSSGLYGFERPFESVISANAYDFIFMLLVLIVLALVLILFEFLGSSPWGRVLRAIRDDEEVVETLGKSVKRFKVEAMGIGSAAAGLSGILLSFQREFINPETFAFELTLYGWLAMVLGGTGDNRGAILGTFLVFGVLFSGTRLITSYIPFSPVRVAALRIMIVASLLIVLMVWRPQGILGDENILSIDQ